MNFWQRNYEEAKRYYEEHGVCDIPLNYNGETGNLGTWAQNQRSAYKGNVLSKDKIQMLNKINFVWDPSERIWEDGYNAAKEYLEKFGHLNIPTDYVTNGFYLGAWIVAQRRAYKIGELSEEKRCKLASIESQWDPKQYEWMERYNIAKKYYKEHGNLCVELKCIYEGFKLGYWLAHQRNAFRNKCLSQDRVALLNQIGMIWNTESKYAIKQRKRVLAVVSNG